MSVFDAFKEIWCADFEFRAEPGDNPRPVCMVAKEIRTGKEIRIWRSALLLMNRAPFDVGNSALFVAYFASAEFGCFLCGNGLIGALAIRGLGHIDAGEKDEMRRLILDNRSWSEEEKRKILAYCASDVIGTAALFNKMTPTIDWPRAMLRGRYVKAVAHMERTGVPIDTDLYNRLVDSWGSLKERLVAAVDEDYNVYEGTKFKTHRFNEFLSRRAIPWPKYPNGILRLDDDTFRDQTRRWPILAPLRELRVTLSGLRLTALEVGSDGRNRCLLSPFKSVTGRNQPSNSKFIFGPATWMRGLIKPPEGYGLAYIDFSS
jgi:DNA polymerase-1